MTEKAEWLFEEFYKGEWSGAIVYHWDGQHAVEYPVDHLYALTAIVRILKDCARDTLDGYTCRARNPHTGEIIPMELL